MSNRNATTLREEKGSGWFSLKGFHVRERDVALERLLLPESPG
jgi:hypothetical protein